MTGHAAMAAGCAGAALLCVGIQYCAKRTLEPRQYGYLRDLLLAGCWMLAALWFGGPNARVVVGSAFLAGIVGLAEDLYSDRRWRIGYLLIGLFCAVAGPSISFLRFADGEYVYLTPAAAGVATTLWFTLFPLVFCHLDEIPGLLGPILAVTFSLMLMTVLLMGRVAADAFFMAFSGMVLLGAFWSRFGNAYRQAGRSMSAMWSVLAAGTAVLGVSKGIVFSSMLFLSLGLFAIPLAEVSLHWVGMIFTERPYGTERLYRRLIRTFDFIFADPPYALPELSKLPELVMNGKLLSEGGIFVLEHPKTFDFSAHPCFSQERVYGSVHFSFFREEARTDA